MFHACSVWVVVRIDGWMRPAGVVKRTMGGEVRRTMGVIVVINSSALTGPGSGIWDLGSGMWDQGSGIRDHGM